MLGLGFRDMAPHGVYVGYRVAGSRFQNLGLRDMAPAMGFSDV